MLHLTTSISSSDLVGGRIVSLVMLMSLLLWTNLWAIVIYNAAFKHTPYRPRFSSSIWRNALRVRPRCHLGSSAVPRRCVICEGAVEQALWFGKTGSSALFQLCYQSGMWCDAHCWGKSVWLGTGEWHSHWACVLGELSLRWGCGVTTPFLPPSSATLPRLLKTWWHPVFVTLVLSFCVWDGGCSRSQM